MKIKIIKADITTLKVDVIVNAAKRSLLGGGGVDGAIHRAAGPQLLDYIKQAYPKGCETGCVKATPSFGIKTCEKIYHTVGPVWDSKDCRIVEEQLYNCYAGCLALLEESIHLKIAFPSISTGVYKFPIGYAAQIAINAILDQSENFDPKHDYEVTICCFSDEDKAVYQAMYKWILADRAKTPRARV
jgi:O-acetyl-ADP-ribose deacetylase (regulator of RNase III)